MALEQIFAELQKELVASREATSWRPTEITAALGASLELAKLVPIPMRLHCEGCGKLHVDQGEFATKPHHTHACQFCGLVWRPAVVCTVGVEFLPGFKDQQ